MNSRDFEPLMLALGQAVYAAQVFETNLASTLIAFKIAKADGSPFADEAAAHDWLDHVARQPIGGLKKEIAALGVLAEQEIDEIAKINAMRIAVAHHFMGQWVDRLDCEDGRASALTYLKGAEDAFLSASRRLQERLMILKAAVSGG